jgi:hypothetical protein
MVILVYDHINAWNSHFGFKRKSCTCWWGKKIRGRLVFKCHMLDATREKVNYIRSMLSIADVALWWVATSTHGHATQNRVAAEVARHCWSGTIVALCCFWSEKLKRLLKETVAGVFNDYHTKKPLNLRLSVILNRSVLSLHHSQSPPSSVTGFKIVRFFYSLIRDWLWTQSTWFHYL